ncbi:MAG TPA: gluconate 2-dehydrogenase subunit 3 family protein [Gemmatimonadaceae bacterium]|nr:gluconate 2-dehydrogenase subunit 3 family protein [Gemmatimonadaceae bacterium]
MHRRELVQLLGAAAVIPFLPRSAEAATAIAERLHRAVDVPFRTLNTAQQAIVSEIADLIIPRTDTPSATDVKVPEFIDLILTEWATDEERAKFLAGLDQIDARSVAWVASQPAPPGQLQPSRFGELTGAQKAGLVNEFDTRREDTEGPGLAFARLKQLTVYGYFTSKPVHEGVLKERMFFDGYHGNVPFTPAV